MNIKRLSDEYVQKYKAMEQQRGRIHGKIGERKRQIARLEKKLERVEGVSWIEEIIKQIAEAMVKKMQGRRYKILGPFGLGSTTSIHFYKIDTEDKDKLFGDNCKMITFRPNDLDHGHIDLVDEATNTGQYPTGSIGEMNGFNHPVVPICDTIDGLIEFMEQQEAAEQLSQ